MEGVSKDFRKYFGKKPKKISQNIRTRTEKPGSAEMKNSGTVLWKKCFSLPGRRQEGKEKLQPNQGVVSSNEKTHAKSFTEILLVRR